MLAELKPYHLRRRAIQQAHNDSIEHRLHRTCDKCGNRLETTAVDEKAHREFVDANDQERANLEKELLVL